MVWKSAGLRVGTRFFWVRMSSLLAVATLLPASCAIAAKLPSGAAKALTAAGWKGYQTVALATVEPERMAGQPTGTAALMRKGKHSLLCVFDYKRIDEAYTLEAAAEKAVHQDKRVPSIWYNEEVYELVYAYDNKKPPAGEPLQEEYVFSWDSDGVWKFHSAKFTFPADPIKQDLFPRITLYWGGDALYYQREWWDELGEWGSATITEEWRHIPREPWVYELQNFDLAHVLAYVAFLSEHEGDELLSLPPSIAQGPAQQLAATETAKGAAIQIGGALQNRWL